MLALGVGLVQVSGSSSSKDNGDSEDGDAAAAGDGQNPLLGLVMVLMACCTSGFAGVYFEKVSVCVVLASTVLISQGRGAREVNVSHTKMRIAWPVECWR